MNASASAAPVHRTGGIKEYVKHHPIVLEVAARLLCAVGVPALARRRRRGLAILMYHGVEAEPLSPACSHVLDASSLRRQLRYLRMHFNVLPLDEALERLAAGTLPDRAVALTFDDGTRNLATNAVPVLRSLGLPAAIFLATGPMGTGETLWPDRLVARFRADDSLVCRSDACRPRYTSAGQRGGSRGGVCGSRRALQGPARRRADGAARIAYHGPRRGVRP